MNPSLPAPSSQPNLLIRPHPFRTEGPRGYLLRLCEANWIPAQDLGLMGIAYDTKRLQTEGLMPDPNVDPELHNIVGKVSELIKNKPRVWNTYHSRFCPLCLQEDTHWLLGWELMFYDACPKHGVWLIDQCSSCSKKLTWQRSLLLRCQCGSDLRTEEASICPDNVVELSRILGNKLLDMPSAFLPPFNTLDVEQTQRLIRYMGTYMNPVSGRNPLKIQQAGVMRSSWTVTSLAAEVLMKWPDAFHQSLEMIQADVRPAEAKQLDSVFGRAYHYLYRGLMDAAFNQVRESFEIWLSYSWRGGLAKRNKRLALLVLEKATWIPGNMAREILGISHQRLLHLIREGSLEGEIFISKSNRNFIMVRRDQLDRVKDKLDGLIDMKTAGALLGFTKKRMLKLLRMLFPTARKTGVTVSMPWSVPRSDVEALLSISERLMRQSIPDEGSVALSHILRYWAWPTEDVFSLIQAVKNGEVVPTSFLDDGVGINGWIFVEAQVKVWRAKSIQGFGTWVTVPQMAKILNIKQQVAYDLVKNDFISGEHLLKQPRGGLRIHRKEIDNFKSNFIFCTEIAQQLGVSPRKAKAVLADRHLEPVSGPGIDQSRQYIYLKSELLNKEMQLIINGKLLNLI